MAEVKRYHKKYQIIMDWKERIESKPEVMYGKPVIKGTRVPVDLLLDKMAAGETVEDLLGAYPKITLEHICACRAYASDSVKNKS
jgi:uncharacterized protein (DUF433 family)